MPGDAGAWAFHALSLEGRSQGPVEWETDRARFLGRGRSAGDAARARRTRAFRHHRRRPRSDRQPAPADPASSRRPVRLCFATGMAAGSRDGRGACAQVPHAERGGAHLRAGDDPRRERPAPSRHFRGRCDAVRASGVACARHPRRRSGRAPRPSPSNELGQPGLWPHAISGDLPILLVRVVGDDAVPLVRQVLQAQEYWRLKGLSADVVIVNEHPASYLDEMQAQLTAVLEDGPWSTWQHRPGGAYLLRADSLGRAERVLLEAVARAVLCGDDGDLRAQLDRPDARPARAAAARAGIAPRSAPASDRVALPPTMFGNGLGGFTDGGRTYTIALDGAEETPMPWANVIANAAFGTIVTASGAAHTWAGNSRENRLTPFANDPIGDPTGEALFVRDDDTGESWSPTPGPMARTAADRLRRSPHGRRDALLAHDPRHRARARRFRRYRRSRPVLPAHADQRRTRGSHAQRLRLQRVGARAASRRRPPARRHRNRSSRAERFCARNAYNQEYARHVAFSYASRPAVFGDRAIAARSSAGTATSRARPR